MTEQEVFEVWSPPASPWSPWVKPVLFTQMENAQGASVARAPEHLLALASTLAAQRLALVVDLPGAQAVDVGLQLAQAGYRPVPLFNTSFGFDAILPVGGILFSLRHGAGVLAALNLPADAPPAFLLDAHRMRERGQPLPGKYDNRWLTFPQDFPSARFLVDHGIAGAVLVQENSGLPADDLAHVLLRWQEEALPLLIKRTDQPGTPEALRVSKPPRYRELWYHFLAVLGLRRNSAGGFGSVVPVPSQGGGGFG